jgi:protein gp37
MENSNISWTHNTWNPWVGCDKVAPECAKCYIGREIRKQVDWQDGGQREPWGEVYLTKTWADPYKWQAELPSDSCKRIFTCSLSDFFHAKVDDRTVCPSSAPAALSLALRQHREVARRGGSTLWRDCAWQVIRETPNLVYLILTKRPELIASRLPKDWPDAFPNVWLGTSTGCNMTLNKMDSLRKIPVHPKAVRFVSCEPLLEDISQNINLEGFGWMIAGGESGSNPEYPWNPQGDWRAEMKGGAGRRTMEIGWAMALLQKARAAGIPFFFKQVTAGRSGVGENALGDLYREFPDPPFGKWAPMSKELVVLRSVNDVGSESSREVATEVSQ